jgi:hypothetical protein
MNRPVRRVTLIALSLCLGAFAVAAVAAQPALGDPPPITGLVSTSHPVPSRWYASPNPVFSWRGASAASSIAGYSYMLDQDPATVPGTTVDLPPFSFAPKRDVPVGVSPGALVAGDFNGDGKADLAVANRDGATVVILPGRGNGNYGRPRSFRVAKYPISIAVADLNRDGKLDLVTYASPQGTRQALIAVLLGNGNGTFKALHDYGLGYEPGAGDAGTLAIADLNGDHRLDIVIATGDQVAWLPGRGDGTFSSRRVAVADTFGFLYSLAVGDLNGDGRRDVIAGGQEGVNQPVGILSVLLGKGNGSFSAPVTAHTGEFLPMVLALADVNHDGKPDLVAADYVDGVDYGDPTFCAVAVFLGKGDGSFTQGDQYEVGPQGQLVPNALKVADFNRDGNADLLVSTGGGLYVLLGNGDGTFQAPVEFASGAGTGSVAVGDFNKDGKPDLAVSGMAVGAVSVYLNRSTQAAYHGIADGVWYFHVRAVDTSAVGGPTATRAVRIDTQPPSTQAPSPVTVQSGGVAHLTYEVGDPPPCAGWCTVRIEVRNGRGAVVYRHTAGHVHNGVLYQTGFRCRLAPGTYRFYVYATDAAGNTQSNVAWNRLVVK